jgi:hypothetical protein
MSLKRIPGICRHCKRLRRLESRQLCPRCYASPTIRVKYPPQPEQAHELLRTICVECRCRVAEIGDSRLCSECGNDPSIVARHPVKIDLGGKDDGRSRLPKLEKYHDTAMPVRCPHGLIDGACASCERIQRAAMGIKQPCEEDAA